ncbi:type 1 phosphatase regulator ypi1 [Moniliophthora roreri]|uniref:Type 1 phosphatases regulator n=1 Tax=Moniliophthora roreri TaxID=221103 RepID=A0A0W0F4K0_MONRR|nr:type 1 phosphatase regulator ypi1 [Moniliophthora roreri]
MAYRSTHTQHRSGTSAPSDGSRTLTITSTPQEYGGDDDSEAGPGSSGTVGTLKLRGATKKSRQRVVWSDDVVDNEGCGRKSSKICCIYHKPRRFDESSSEEDSDSDSDSSCGGHGHNHQHRARRSSGSGGERLQRQADGGGVTQLESEDSDGRNAYEIAPKNSKGKYKA